MKSQFFLNYKVYAILSMELVVWLNLWLIGVGNYVIRSKLKKIETNYRVWDIKVVVHGWEY